jgi:uncharacterized membrane protein
VADAPRAGGAARGAGRNDAVDLVRGAAMVLMALDHVRDYFGRSGARPTNIAATTVPLFLTRWVTHFCAPVFVFLAGTAAFLSGSSGRSRAGLSRFLLTRGLWLVLLELTVVRLAWLFELSYRFVMLQVIWAIGWSMVALAGLIWLPRSAIAVVGVAMVAGHNALDHVRAASLGRARWLWVVLHEGGRLAPFRGTRAIALYPLVPWIGVMAAGYAFGAWAVLERGARRRRTLALGLALCAAFVLVRALNRYGDPEPWVHSPRGALYTLLSFLNCEKYPPSLDYLLMTLGPALCALAAMDLPAPPRVLAPLRAFGRAPLFYYVVHLFVIHAAAVGAARLWGTRGGGFAGSGEVGFGLAGVYAVWALVVVGLYAPTAWFARLKQRRREWRWLSYL